MAIKAVSRLISGAADYEEGEWTPVLEGTTAAGVHTYNGRSGRFIRLGPMTIAWFQINLDALGTGENAPSGFAQIAGLPFSARDNTPTDYLTYPAAFADLSFVGMNFAEGYTSLHGRIFNGASAIRLRLSGDGIGAGNLDVSEIGATSLLIGSTVYLVE